MRVRNILIIISAVIFLIGCSGNNNDEKKTYKKIEITQNSTIVCFGNSLTQGYGASDKYFDDDYPIDTSKAYPHYLSQKVNIPVINLGINGETSDDALERVNSVLSYNPAIIIIEFGANDLFNQISYDSWFPSIRDPHFVAQVERNFEELLTYLVDDNRQIYLVKFYNKDMAVELLKPFGYMSIYEDYEIMFSNLKKKYGVELITNIWDGIWDRNGAKKELMYDDYYYPIDVHPNAEGYIIMADNYFNTIKGFLEFNDLL
jgi:lysophospholipase L1-like esterase